MSVPVNTTSIRTGPIDTTHIPTKSTTPLEITSLETSQTTSGIVEPTSQPLTTTTTTTTTFTTTTTTNKWYTNRTRKYNTSLSSSLVLNKEGKPKDLDTPDKYKQTTQCVTHQTCPS